MYPSSTKLTLLTVSSRNVYASVVLLGHLDVNVVELQVDKMLAAAPVRLIFSVYSHGQHVCTTKYSPKVEVSLQTLSVLLEGLSHFAHPSRV